MTARRTKLLLKIHNMHCAGCEALVERKFKALPGVRSARVSHATGRAQVFIADKELRLRDFERAISAEGYSVSWWAERSKRQDVPVRRNTAQDYTDIGTMFIFVVAVYLTLRQFDLLPEGLAITKNMSYGFVFIIGLAAAFSSCLAVTGGLLLAVAARYNERHPSLDGFQKFKPTLYFNAGRVVSYTILGGAVGELGSAFTLSQSGTAILTIVASVIMIILGFQLLNLFPWMRHFQPRIPKIISHRIHDLSSGESHNRFAPLTLGALTFFLPCGFTQALQFYVLSTGSPVTGALTMLIFSLGTLPSLLSVSMISSFASGSFRQQFLRFAGVLVVSIGLWNIDNGLALTGINFPSLSFTADTASSTASSASSQPVPVVDGVQTASMTIRGYRYSPYRFTVQAGIPVKWMIDGRNAAGCARVIVSRSLRIAKYLSPDGETAITFTPKTPGEYRFSCSMGMTTRGAAFIVVPQVEDSATSALMPRKTAS